MSHRSFEDTSFARAQPGFKKIVVQRAVSVLFHDAAGA